MNPLFFLIVAELFAFGLMWHNKQARPEHDRESEKPDPAVLFYKRNCKRTTADAALKRCSAKTESTVVGFLLEVTQAVAAIWKGARKQKTATGDVVLPKESPAAPIDSASK